MSCLCSCSQMGCLVTVVALKGGIFPKSISEMLGFSFRSLPRGARFEWTLRVAGAGAAEMASMGGGYGGGARFEWTLRVAGAGAAEMAWEEATEGERGLSGR